MTTHLVPRDGDIDLELNGERLAFSSSAERGKPRWFELTIYRSGSGRWVVAGAGRTTMPDEVDRFWARVCTSPAEVLEALYRRGEGGRYLTHTAREALEDAAERDVALRTVLVERV